MSDWPSLPLEEWKDTCATLHMWTQIVGKVRLAQTPLVNHWWNVPLYVTARGLTTSAMPYEEGSFQIDFDFISHRLLIQRSDGGTNTIALTRLAVADFYEQVMRALRDLGIEVEIWTMPVEIENPIRFEEDHEHASYDAEYVNRFWRILLQAERILTDFRSRFIGKVSPVHFFWGSFDLAVTRFSGRTAPSHPGAPNIGHFVAVEAYSHEVSSCGFWPGGGGPVDEPAFYAYAYPEPQGFRDYPIRPAEGFYHTGMGEFLLPYDVIRTAKSPDQVLLSFLQSTYEAAATCAKWDRRALERQ